MAGHAPLARSGISGRPTVLAQLRDVRGCSGAYLASAGSASGATSPGAHATNPHRDLKWPGGPRCRRQESGVVAVAAKFNAMTVQGDLIKPGYLPTKSDEGKWGGGSNCAIVPLKRRSTTLDRMSSVAAVATDCSVAEVFREPVDEPVTEATLL